MSTTSSSDRPQSITPEQLQQLPVVHQAHIPETYLDSMGHMNVMWYAHLFGHGIGGLFRMIGFTREYCLENKAGSFALKQYTSYLSEVRAGENVTVRTRLLGRSAKRMHLMHFMVKDSGEILAATSEILAAHVDMRVRRMSPFAPQIADALDKLIEEHAKLAWPAPSVTGPIRP